MFNLSKKANTHLSKFYKTKDIIHWFAAFSNHVWDELEFASKFDKSISKTDEREFTNELVRGIAKLIHRDEIPIPVRLFHSPKEGVNGSDLEIILQLGKDKNLIFACQAKRLYVETDAAKKNNLNAKYAQLNYKKGLQKKQVIDYAERVNGFPLYLLYNYSEHDFNINSFYPNKELYGCTLINAYNLEENPPESPVVSNLHPPAVPLVSIVKFKNIPTLNMLWGKSSSEHNAQFISDKKIFDDGRWYEIAPPLYPPKRFVSSINMQELLKGNINLNGVSVERPFNPKFRIVFTQDIIEDRKINFSI
jgi:hypothetical protein